MNTDSSNVRNINAGEIPWYQNPRVLIIIAVIYIGFPIDLIPDQIPLLGAADDAAIIYTLFKKIVKSVREQKAEIA